MRSERERVRRMRARARAAELRQPIAEFTASANYSPAKCINVPRIESETTEFSLSLTFPFHSIPFRFDFFSASRAITVQRVNTKNPNSSTRSLSDRYFTISKLAEGGTKKKILWQKLCDL